MSRWREALEQVAERDLTDEEVAALVHHLDGQGYYVKVVPHTPPRVVPEKLPELTREQVETDLNWLRQKGRIDE